MIQVSRRVKRFRVKKSSHIIPILEITGETKNITRKMLIEREAHRSPGLLLFLLCPAIPLILHIIERLPGELQMTHGANSHTKVRKYLLLSPIGNVVSTRYQ